jgi:Kef-type K+ transport system membrane component KefB
MLDEALKEEFSHEEEKKASVGKQYNETVSANEGTTETVIIISQKKEKERAANRTAEAENASSDNGGGSGHTTSSGIHPFSGNKNDKDEEMPKDYDIDTDYDEDSKSSLNQETDVDRIIDSKDNEYVLSKPNEEGSMGLTLDPQLIRDLGVLIGVCAVGGLAMEAVRQPTINGYFLAGSAVGPGGLKWIKEIVQVQSVAQLGVVLLLFIMGLELNLSKLRAVRDVAILGGSLQIILMSTLGGVAAAVIGVGTYQGAFVGAMLAMSSTSVVVKCLQDSRASNTPHAQITIGTLVLQDCVVGLLFAFMPVLASAGSASGGVSLRELAAVAGRVMAMLAVTLAVAALAAATFLPMLTRQISKFSKETFLITILGFCLAASMATTRVGVSAELGAFLAGVLLSVTDQQEAIVAAVEPVGHLFLALFIASTGLTIAPAFIAEHLLVLAAVVAVVVTAKSLLIAGVVLAFRFPLDTALAVGINLAQIGEFGFVLLSMANQHGIIASQVYLLLMGTTALSLLLTPFMIQISVRLPKSNRGGDLGVVHSPSSAIANTNGGGSLLGGNTNMNNLKASLNGGSADDVEQPTSSMVSSQQLPFLLSSGGASRSTSLGGKESPVPLYPSPDRHGSGRGDVDVNGDGMGGGGSRRGGWHQMLQPRRHTGK